MRRWRNGKRPPSKRDGRVRIPGDAPRSVGVNGYLTRPSTWRLRVRPPHGALTAPRYGLGSGGFHLREQPWGLSPRCGYSSAHGLKDKGTRLRTWRWGFDSSWARSRSASSMGERPAHTRGTEVRFLRRVRWPNPKRPRNWPVKPAIRGSRPLGHPRRRWHSGDCPRL